LVRGVMERKRMAQGTPRDNKVYMYNNEKDEYTRARTKDRGNFGNRPTHQRNGGKAGSAIS